MINKGTLYRIAEDTVPPYLWRKFKRTSLYRRIAHSANSITAKPKLENVAFTAGHASGLVMRMDPHGSWQQEMIEGKYDIELFDELHQHLASKKPAVIYDIGAHVCFHTLVFAKMAGETDHVYAFEPNAANSERARENIELNPSVNKRITLLQTALSNENGVTTFLSTNDIEGGTSTGGFITNASTLWERNRYTEKVGFKEGKVQLATIDTLIAEGKIKPPTVMKVDVEGAEQLVLEGAKSMLKAHHPVIVIEFHSIYSAYSSMEHLNAFGYTSKLLKKEPDGRVMIIAV